MKKNKKCIDCGSSEIKERKRCSECFTTYNRSRVNKYYHDLIKSGGKRKRYGIIKCFLCGNDLIKNRPDQIAHGKCKKLFPMSYNLYPRDKTGKYMIGKKTIIDLGIVVPKKTVVHHIDNNPMNNSLKNLMIISLSNHSKLHSFLREQYVVHKSIYGDDDKKWNKIIIKLNFIWIKQNKLKLICINTENANGYNVDANKIYILKQ